MKPRNAYHIHVLPKGALPKVKTVKPLTLGSLPLGSRTWQTVGESIEVRQHGESVWLFLQAQAEERTLNGLETVLWAPHAFGYMAEMCHSKTQIRQNSCSTTDTSLIDLATPDNGRRHCVQSLKNML